MPISNDIKILRRVFIEMYDFSKRELYFLIFFICLFVFYHLAIYLIRNGSSGNYSYELIAADRSPYYYQQLDTASNLRSYIPKEVGLVTFDLNLLSAEQLLSLGLPEHKVKAIINNRSKGGKYLTPSDLQKIYNLSPADYQRIARYIRINQSNMAKASNFKPFSNHKPQEPKALPLHSCTAEQLQLFRGIGPHFANKIIQYRERLGGFISIDQIREVYGLPDSTFQHISTRLTLNPNLIRKININTASGEQLSQHPYLAKWQVEDILKNRPIYGQADLLELYTFRKENSRKILPYLEY